MNVRVRRLLVSHALSATAMALPWPAILALTWRHQPDLVGPVAAARMVPYVLLSWAIGGLGDRIGRLRMLRISSWARLPLLLATGFLVVVDAPVAAAVAASVAVAAGTPAFPSLAAMLGDGRSSAEATGWLVTIEVSAFVVGPAVGGLLLGLGGEPGQVVAVASALLGSLALVGLVGLDGAAVDRASRRERVSWHVGLVTLLRRLPVVRAIAVVMALNFALAALGVALLPLTTLVWHAGEPEFGLATASLGFGSLATPVVLRALGRRRHSTGTLLVLVLMPLVVLCGVGSWLVALAPLAAFGAATTLVECETTRVLQCEAPGEYRALAIGFADTAMIAAALVGSSAGPGLAETLGPDGLLLALAAGVGAVCLVALRPRATPLPAEADASGQR